MIALLMIVLTLALVVINLLGLTLAATRLTGSYAVAKAAGPVLLVAPLFFLEHFVGLGSLTWLWPPATAASLWLIRRDLGKVKANWHDEALFLVGFGYALAWRFCFPDLKASSEKLADLGFIANYIDGTRLPPLDRWFPPFAFDVYYGLQFYSVALLGRILGVGAGMAYHLGFCALVGLATAAAGAAARRFCEGRRWYLLVTAVFLVGGTGASPLIHLLRAHPPVSDSVRFIGGAATPGHVTTEFGRRLVAAAGVPAKEAIELPAETFGYLTYLGDLHPPVAGFFLLALALVCLAALETGEDERFSEAMLAATVPLTLAANAWNLPLQAALVAFWLLWRVASRRPPHWGAVAAGAGAGFAAILPFLSTYAWRTTEYSKSIAWVRPGEHTPPLLGFILLYPLLAVLAAALWTRRTRS
ncbi:MAG: DUF2298 domain-containing protein, partial [Acidobacteria bacterium]|nr:DUF2298 domain-containing protein [Acidobacteriota bacterium]